MQDVLDVMAAILNGLKTPITVYWFTFSMWNVLLFTMISSVVAYFLGGLLRE